MNFHEFHDQLTQVKTGHLLEKETKVLIAIDGPHCTVQNLFYYSTCILPDYMAHEMTKDFSKNSHFENMIFGFLLRCQNSLR